MLGLLGTVLSAAVIAWGLFSRGTDRYVLVGLGVMMFAASLLLVAVVVIRGGPSQPVSRVRVGQLAGAYRRSAKRGGKQLAGVVLGLLWLAWLTARLVTAIVMAEWGYAALYGLLIGGAAFLALVRGAALLQREASE
jgi:hypothetical protein